MKPQQLYHAMKDLAERLRITVREQNLRQPGIKVRSGLCRVKGQWVFILDKHKNIHQKCRLLGTCLASMPMDDVYIVPALREYIEKHRMGAVDERLIFQSRERASTPSE
jgi:hypothetical protein